MTDPTYSTCLRNTTPSIVRVDDLDLKWRPRGEQGDTVDVAELKNPWQIHTSRDLYDAIDRGWLVPAVSYNQPKVNRTGRVVINKPTGPFVARDPNAPKPPEPSATFVAYDNEEKEVVSPKFEEEERPRPVVVPPPAENENVVAGVDQADPSWEEKTIEAGLRGSETPAVDEVPPPQDASSISVSVSTSAEPSEAKIAGCSHIKKDGKPCKNNAQPDSETCYVHGPLM